MLISRSGFVEENAVVNVPSLWFSLVFFLDEKLEILKGEIIMWWYSLLLSTSLFRWPNCGSSTFKYSFPY
jgi:hypothetical protein